jgi:uncharacterized protein YidB (DUF937 family)
MANKMPSMLALLGLLAVAGYQNRDKIAGALKRLQNETPSDAPNGEGGVLGTLLGAAAGSGGLTGGLADLMNSFRNAGQADVADSWVTPGVPTGGLTPDQVEQAIGAENLEELSARTGLGREELLRRLSTAIPENVDRLTPDGKFPTEDDARQYFVSGGA